MRVVYYHLISDSKFDFFNGLVVSKKKFEEDVNYYKKHYEVITFRDIQRYKDEGKSLKKCLIITFDDGYKENFRNVTGILDKHNVKATFFMNSSTIDNRALMWRDALTHLSDRTPETKLEGFKKGVLFPKDEQFDILGSTKNMHLNKLEKEIDILWNDVTGVSQQDFAMRNNIYVSTEDLKSLIHDGHEIGVHSNKHPNFSTLSELEGIEEIETAYKYFESKLNYQPISMSFPFGNKPSDQGFYDSLMRKTRLRYFLGIDYSISSNKDIHNNYKLERLGMEDGRNFYVSFYLRPLIRFIR